MPDLSAVTNWLINSTSSLWAFMISCWFMSLVLVVKFILPKLVRLFRLSIGR